MFLAHVYFKTSYVDIKHPQTLHLVGQLCISKHHMLILNFLFPFLSGVDYAISKHHMLILNKNLYKYMS